MTTAIVHTKSKTELGAKSFIIPLIHIIDRMRTIHKDSLEYHNQAFHHKEIG